MTALIFSLFLMNGLARAEIFDYACEDESAGIRAFGSFERADGFYLAASDLTVTTPTETKKFFERAVSIAEEDGAVTIHSRLNDGSSVRLQQRHSSDGRDHLAIYLRGGGHGTIKHRTDGATCVVTAEKRNETYD